MSDFSSPTRINMTAGGVGTVEYGGGAQGQMAIFYTRPVHNPVKSAEAGAPIYEDKIYVRISPPGERLNIIDRPATAQDRRIWAQQWVAFEQNKEQKPVGTPVDLLYPDSPAVGAMMKANGVHTIQQLANLSANAIENIGMGAQRYVNDAQTYIKAAEGGAGNIQLRRELESLQRDNTVLQRKVDECMAEIDRLRAGGMAQSVTLTAAQLQEMLQGAAQRPQMPFPQQATKTFDAAEAQINAAHPTKLISDAEPTKQKRVRL